MTILYEKIGRRYHPVMTDDWYQSTRLIDMEKPGHILVTITGECTSYYRHVDPARVEVLAALKECQEDIVSAMHTASEFKPRSEVLSARHKKAYALYQASIPKSEREALWAGSIRDGVEAAVRVMESRIYK